MIRSILFLFVALPLFAFDHQQSGRVRIPLKEVKPATSEGLSIRRSKQAKTTAQIVRPKGNVSIDFSKREDLDKVKEGDTILLEEGRYDHLPYQLPAVTFIGIEGKTAVGKLPIPDHLPGWQLNYMVGNGSRYWDIEFGWMEFAAMKDRVFFVNCKFNGIKNTSSNFTTDGQSAIVIALSDFGGYTNSESASVSFNTKMALFSSLVRRADSDGKNREWMEVETATEYLFSSAAKELHKKLGEARLAAVKVAGSSITPQLVETLNSSRGQILKEAGEADRNMITKTKSFHASTYDEVMRYLLWKLNWKPEVKEDEIKQIIARVKTELKKGNVLIAYAMMNHAVVKHGAAEHAPAKSLIIETQKAAGDRYGCSLDGDKAINIVREWAAKSIPVLNISVPGAPCRIAINFSTSQETKFVEAITASVTETRLEEYDPMIRYKEMMRAAAAKEAEKAFTAGMDASVERMKDTARKMYAYRVRREGDFLVYGQGNFAGQASAGTLSAQSQANANASKMAAAANERGMQIREVKERKDTFYLNYSTSIGIDAAITKKGSTSRRMKGPVINLSWSRGPCDRKAKNEFDVSIARGECERNGARSGQEFDGPFERRYHQNYVYPFLATFVAEEVVPKAIQKIQQAKGAKDAGTKLESLLLTSFTNVGEVREEEIVKLATEVVGEPLKLGDFSNYLGIE